MAARSRVYMAEHVDDLWELSREPEGKVKDYAKMLIKLCQAEFELEKGSIDWVSKNFGMLELYHGTPRVLGQVCFFSSDGRQCGAEFVKRVQLSNGRFGMRKSGLEDSFHRKVIKEVIIQHHLEDLEGSRIPKMLFFGIHNCPEISAFFFIRELYEPILHPSEVSPGELRELLSIVHARGVLLNCEKFQFPPLARVDSKLVLVDLFSAVFEENKARFEEEVECLTSLCGAAT